MNYENLLKENKKDGRLRVIAYGSSNTGRRIPGMHWFDMLELAYNQNSEPPGYFLNSGVGGETTRDLLRRFDKDLSVFKPDIAIITIGGNDANPDMNLTSAEFRNNMIKLISKLKDIGTLPIIQTYYAYDPNQLSIEHGSMLTELMDINNNLGSQLNIPVIDHFSRWNKFRDKYTAEYTKLMLDGLHVNKIGNLIMGFYLINKLGLNIQLESGIDYNEAKRVYALMEKSNED